MRTITINTTHGNLQFDIHGNQMNVTNLDTGESLYSGYPDQQIVNAMDPEYDEDYAANVGQEWADNLYGQIDD